MQDLYSNFHFIKIGSEDIPVSAGVETGDFSTILFLILVGFLMLSMLALLFNFKKSINLRTKISSINKSTTAISVFKLISAFIIFILLLFTVWFFSLNKTIAIGKSDNSICTLSDVNVNVSDNGIDSIDSAILSNETIDTSVSIETISILSDEQSISDTIWKIKYEGKYIYDDFPGKSVSLENPIEVQPGMKLTLDFEITMDSQTAVSLVGSNPVQLCISYSNSQQEEAIIVVEESIEDFSICLDSLTSIPSSLKDTLKEQIAQLANETEETIASLSSKEEIDVVLKEYYEKVLFVVKETSKDNFDIVAENVDNLVLNSHNLNSADKQEFQNEIETAYNETLETIESQKDLDSVNSAILASNQIFNNISKKIEAAEEAATWTVTFVTNGASSTVLEQHIKFGNLASDPGIIYKDGYDLIGWYSNPEFSSDTSWNFNENKVGEDAGDVDSCTLTLYAKWDGKQISVSFVINDHGTQPLDSTVKVGEQYGELPDNSDISWNFLGWYLDSSLTNEVTSSTIVKTTTNHNLYAKWEEKQEELSVDVDFRNYTKEAGKELTINVSDDISIIIEKDCEQWPKGAIHTWNAENNNMYLINNTGKSISKITFESNSLNPAGATNLRWFLKGYNSEGQWDLLSTIDIGGGTPENVFFTIQPTESQWGYEKYAMHNQYSYVQGGMFSIKIWFFDD